MAGKCLTIVVANILVSFISGQQSTDGTKDMKNYIFEGLNKDAKPCDSAFEFMCGTWMSKIPVGEPASYFIEDNANQNKTDILMYNAIKEISLNDQSVPAYKQWLRTYFDQCLNANMSGNDSIKQVFNGLQRVIGPPPILTMDKTAFDALTKRSIWNVAGQVQRKLAEGVFFSTRVTDVSTDCNKLKPILTFEPRYLYDDELNKTEIQQSVLGMASLLAITINVDELSAKVEKLVAFDKDLRDYVNSSQTNEDMYDYTVLNNTDDLNKLNPKIDWSQFFNGLFSQEQLANWNQAATWFQIRGKKYFQQLDDIVGKYDVETVFNYVFYKAMRLRYSTVSSPDEFAGTIDRVPSCVQSVKNIYSTAAAKLFFDYSKQNPMDWKNDLEIITDYIFTALKSMVYKMKWLSIEEKAGIVGKANFMKLTQPIPEWLSSDVEVEKRSIKFDADKGLYDNSINIDKWQYILGLDRVVNEDSSNKEIRFYFDYVFYAGMELEISFAAILPPLYNFNYPLAAKYALIGNRIAEAMLDGFSSGYVWEHPPDSAPFLNESKIDKLKDPVQCMKTQIATLDCKDNATKCRNPEENWEFERMLKQVDAVQVAYNAFKLASQNEAAVAAPVDGLTEYSWDQTFHLLVGRSYCKSYAMDSEEDGGETRNRNRLVKIFRNLPSYAKLFQCPTTASAVVVGKPCGLWSNID